ncbi:uncharacterized protein LOC135309713 [Plodia interpunctella]|uniref:uncharacterized protein LOC135309713 n=1 Tax=Plodia interpunctella TaxID=58824 RepID=UPI003100DAAD
MKSLIGVAFFLIAISYGTTEEIRQRSPKCAARYGYSPIDGSCDAYIECMDFEARHMQCPDGLHYDPNAVWPAYPCGYPSEVPCKGRGSPQPAKATAECPHQYGFFPSPRATSSECGYYHRCVEGKALEMQCPPGLAFNPETARCDWPDLVASCNPDEFLGFKCPPPQLDENNKPLDIVINFKYEGNCFAFYSCIHGNARLLTCDPGFGFDPSFGSCRPSDKINCENPRHAPISKEMKVIAEQTDPNIANETKILLSKNEKLIERPQITYTNTDLTTTGVNTKTKQLSSSLSPVRPIIKHLKDTLRTTTSTYSRNTISPQFPISHVLRKQEPCSDPSLAECKPKSLKRPSLPYKPNITSSCPRWYGHFPLDFTECSKYIRCEFGKPTIMPCPAGLVFNAELEVCDWPVNVPSCNPEVFRGFKCPVSEIDKNGTEDTIINFRYGQSCKKYIACQDGRPRLLHCDLGLSFSHETGSCIRSDFVSDCKKRK